jgi:glyoxylase-like metal-dependent hydrolase (beta-lactamase superfamily II)
LSFSGLLPPAARAPVGVGYDPRVSFRGPLLISAANPGPYTGDGNNTWLLDGREPTLIDAGTGEPAHLEAIAEALDGRPLARVLLTHDHPDHASGVPAIRDCWPDVEVLAVATTRAPSRTLLDREKVRAGDHTLQVVYTPGHAPDHVCFWDDMSRELYTGDMVLMDSSVLIPGGRGGNLRAYLSSLDLLQSHAPLRLYPGHGRIITDPAAVIARAIAHRRAREVEVLACLDDGLTTAEAIAARLYADLPADLQHAARLTVEAHLEKIREDRTGGA